jgi:two-component system sensor kinase FixL
MDPAGGRSSNLVQAAFTTVMLGVAVGLFILVAMFGADRRLASTPRMLFTGGSVLTAVGLVSGIWRRDRVIPVLAVAILAIGAVSIVMILLFPDARQAGPSSALSAAWAELAMAVVNLAAGVALLFTLSSRQPIKLAAMTVIRISIWVGAYWQLASLVLYGRFKRLFDGDAAMVQGFVILTMVVSWSLLLRGDRRWLRTFTDADRTVALARFILPVAMAPVVGAYLTNLAARYGAFPTDVAPLLSIEMSSVTLLIVGSATLRSIWRERRGRETLAGALARSPVIIHSSDGLIEYWPHGCEALYEYTAEEAIGRRASDLLKTRYPIPREEIEAILRRDGEWAGDLRQTTRGGKRLWVASTSVIDSSSDDRAYKVVETLTDITDLTLTNAALNDSVASLTAAVEAYDLGIVDYDAVTDKIRFSSEYERIVGVEPGSLGSDMAAWQSLLSPADAERFMNWFAQDVACRRTQRAISVKVGLRDGARRDLSGVLRYRYSSDNKLLRIVGIYMDVTEQLRDRAELEARGTRLLELQSELTHTSRLSAMGEMAAALAHELNQPLTAVGNSVGAIELILKDGHQPFDERARQRILRAARHAETQAVRAGEIVRRLRAFIARGEADTQVEDLDQLIDDAVGLALPNPAAAQVAVAKAIDPGASRVLADRIQIQQVVVNLVRNAVESMRLQFRPRRLRITATASEGMALIRVEDNGPGVAPEMVDRLFSPFLSTKKDGMGVGLSICRRIIETHGGAMWFEPAPEGGARFNFTLPMDSSEMKHDAIQDGSHR